MKRSESLLFELNTRGQGEVRRMIRDFSLHKFHYVLLHGTRHVDGGLRWRTSNRRRGDLAPVCVGLGTVTLKSSTFAPRR